MVLIIALIPALLIYAASRFTQSKSVTYLAAAGAAALGILTGNPVYTGVDLLFVCIATYISIAELTADMKCQHSSYGQSRAADSLRGSPSRTSTGIEEGYDAKAVWLAKPPEVRAAELAAARAALAQRAKPKPEEE